MIIGIDASKCAIAAKTGVEWYVHHLLSTMASFRSSHAVRLYVKKRVPFLLPDRWQEQKLSWPFPMLWTQGGLSLEMCVHPPDLLFIPSSALPLVLPGRSITTIHDVGFLQERTYRSVRELRYLEWSTQRAVERASHIITVSEFSKSELIGNFHADPARVSAIPLAAVPSPPISQEMVTSVCAVYGFERPYLIFVSRIDARKNVALLLRAFARLKEQRAYEGDLVLVGPLGFGGEEIVKRMNAHPFASSIHYVGWISEHDKDALMVGADVFVLPSMYEGFGLAVLEAQSRGVPVVCSSTTSLPEVAGEAAAFVDPSSVNSIAEGILRVLGDDDYRRTLVAKGRENAARYSWQRTAQQTWNIIERVLAAH